MTYVAVLIIAVIIIIGVMSGKKTFDDTKRLAEEGKTIAREAAFYENEEIFKTSASYEDVCQKLKETDLNDTKANIQNDFEGYRLVFFKSADEWNAVLEDHGKQDDKNILQFYFKAWRTGRYGTVKALSMNVLVTAVEKTILSLDPSATVETHKMQLTTK